MGWEWYLCGKGFEEAKLVSFAFVQFIYSFRVVKVGEERLWSPLSIRDLVMVLGNIWRLHIQDLLNDHFVVPQSLFLDCKVKLCDWIVITSSQSNKPGQDDRLVRRVLGVTYNMIMLIWSSLVVSVKCGLKPHVASSKSFHYVLIIIIHREISSHWPS